MFCCSSRTTCWSKLNLSVRQYVHISTLQRIQEPNKFLSEMPHKYLIYTLHILHTVMFCGDLSLSAVCVSVNVCVRTEITCSLCSCYLSAVVFCSIQTVFNMLPIMYIQTEAVRYEGPCYVSEDGCQEKEWSHDQTRGPEKPAGTHRMYR